MKKKGFTLIELIVVIAIIGVLAAILVPAMLGYVKKSKITSANSSAKSINTAVQSALTDMDGEDVAKVSRSTLTMLFDEASLEGWQTGTGFKATADTLNASSNMSVFQYKVYTYFNDITKLTSCVIDIQKGTCRAVVVTNGNYPGTCPKQFSVDDYDSKYDYASSANLAQLLNYALSTTYSFS